MLSFQDLRVFRSKKNLEAEAQRTKRERMRCLSGTHLGFFLRVILNVKYLYLEKTKSRVLSVLLLIYEIKRQFDQETLILDCAGMFYTPHTHIPQPNQHTPHTQHTTQPTHTSHTTYNPTNTHLTHNPTNTHLTKPENLIHQQLLMPGADTGGGGGTFATP